MTDKTREKDGFSLWPEKILGPRPGLKELNFVCWLLFVLFLLLPVALYLFVRYKAGARFENLLPIDFVYFYGIGRLANEFPVSHFYDLKLQLQVFNSIFPLHGEAWGASPYPPLVGRFFSLYARFSIATAYYMWLVTSLALYLTGVVATLKAVFPREKLKSSLVICFALAFPSFLYFTLIVGQIGTIAVFAFGVGIYQEQKSRPFAAGLALSVLAYKPTLLVLLLPMLLLTRRFRALAGFVGGVFGWIAVTTLICGWQIWADWIRVLTIFAGRDGISGKSLVKRWGYVDLYSFWHLIGAGSGRGLLLLFVLIVTLLVWLAVLFWRSTSIGRPQQLLLWAAVLTWTLLINVYVPYYDVVLVVLPIVLALGALGELDQLKTRTSVTILGLAIFVTSAFSEAYAERYSVQPLTILLLVLALFETASLQRALRNGAVAPDAMCPSPLALMRE